MRTLVVALFLAVGLAAAKPAIATSIVDTGPGTSVLVGWTLSNLGPNDIQWLAAEFAVSQEWIITDVQGWIDPFNSGDVRFRLYSDGGDLPGAPLFDQSLTIPGTGATTWYGPSGLSWLIGPGSYWLAFEVPNIGFYGSMPFPSGTPLINEASSNLVPPNYLGLDTLDLGVRVFGTAVDDAAVPEPASLVLFASGLIAAGARRWRTRRRAA